MRSYIFTPKLIYIKYKLYQYLFLLVGLTACSSDDDGSNGSSDIQINPPEWIRGSWELENGTDLNRVFRFSTDDFIIITTSVQQSQRQQLEQFEESGSDVSTEEDATDDFYSLRLNYPAGQSLIYEFSRISDNEMRYEQSNAIYIKQ